MGFEAVLLGGLLYASLGCSLFFLYYSVRNRHKRGAKSLAVLFVGISLWVLSDVLQLHTSGTPAPPIGIDARLLGPDIGVIGVLLFGLEYTGRDDLLDRRLLAALAVKPLLSIAVLLSPLRDDLFVASGTDPVNLGYTFGITVIQVTHTLYSWALVFIGLGLLAQMAVRADYGYRRQIATIIAAVGFPLGMNILFHADILRRDATSIGFFVTASVVMYATFRLKLMETIPLARQTVLEEMEDMVVVLDEQDRIVSVNDAVRERFGPETAFEGRSASTLFDTQIPDDGEQIFATEATIDGEACYLEISSSPVSDYRGAELGRVLVCRDVTEREQQEEQLRKREAELELLKDLQSRFLRHNLRNELNVVRLNAAMLHDPDDPEERAQYELILEKTDRVLDWGTKARTIERLIETEEQTAHDLTETISRIVVESNQQYPGVTFDTDLDDDLWIEAVPQVHHAIENIVDNAAEHNTADSPRVGITGERANGTVTVTVDDNGPGLEQLEIEAIREEEEGSLTHASGLGLWLVYWVLDKSGGEMQFDTEDGTSIRMEFPATQDPDSR
jgi:PAS domain S-box-containing protein